MKKKILLIFSILITTSCTHTRGHFFEEAKSFFYRNIAGISNDEIYVRKGVEGKIYIIKKLVTEFNEVINKADQPTNVYSFLNASKVYKRAYFITVKENLEKYLMLLKLDLIKTINLEKIKTKEYKNKLLEYYTLYNEAVIQLHNIYYYIGYTSQNWDQYRWDFLDIYSLIAPRELAVELQKANPFLSAGRLTPLKSLDDKHLTSIKVNGKAPFQDLFPKGRYSRLNTHLENVVVRSHKFSETILNEVKKITKDPKLRKNDLIQLYPSAEMRMSIEILARSYSDDIVEFNKLNQLLAVRETMLALWSSHRYEGGSKREEILANNCAHGALSFKSETGSKDLHQSYYLSSLYRSDYFYTVSPEIHEKIYDLISAYPIGHFYKGNPSVFPFGVFNSSRQKSEIREIYKRDEAFYNEILTKLVHPNSASPEMIDYLKNTFGIDYTDESQGTVGEKVSGILEVIQVTDLMQLERHQLSIKKDFFYHTTFIDDPLSPEYFAAQIATTAFEIKKEGVLNSLVEIFQAENSKKIQQDFEKALDNFKNSYLQEMTQIIYQNISEILNKSSLADLKKKRKIQWIQDGIFSSQMLKAKRILNQFIGEKEITQEKSGHVAEDLRIDVRNYTELQQIILSQLQLKNNKDLATLIAEDPELSSFLKSYFKMIRYYVDKDNEEIAKNKLSNIENLDHMSFNRDDFKKLSVNLWKGVFKTSKKFSQKFWISGEEDLSRWKKFIDGKYIKGRVIPKRKNEEDDDAQEEKHAPLIEVKLDEITVTGTPYPPCSIETLDWIHLAITRKLTVSRITNEMAKLYKSKDSANAKRFQNQYKSYINESREGKFHCEKQLRSFKTCQGRVKSLTGRYQAESERSYQGTFSENYINEICDYSQFDTAVDKMAIYRRNPVPNFSPQKYLIGPAPPQEAEVQATSMQEKEEDLDLATKLYRTLFLEPSTGPQEIKSEEAPEIPRISSKNVYWARVILFEITKMLNLSPSLLKSETLPLTPSYKEKDFVQFYQAKNLIAQAGTIEPFLGSHILEVKPYSGPIHKGQKIWDIKEIKASDALYNLYRGNKFRNLTDSQIENVLDNFIEDTQRSLKSQDVLKRFCEADSENYKDDDNFTFLFDRTEHLRAQIIAKAKQAGYPFNLNKLNKKLFRKVRPGFWLVHNILEPILGIGFAVLMLTGIVLFTFYGGAAASVFATIQSSLVGKLLFTATAGHFLNFSFAIISVVALKHYAFDRPPVLNFHRAYVNSTQLIDSDHYYQPIHKISDLEKLEKDIKEQKMNLYIYGLGGMLDIGFLSHTFKAVKAHMGFIRAKFLAETLPNVEIQTGIAKGLKRVPRKVYYEGKWRFFKNSLERIKNPFVNFMKRLPVYQKNVSQEILDNLPSIKLNQLLKSGTRVSIPSIKNASQLSLESKRFASFLLELNQRIDYQLIALLKKTASAPKYLKQSRYKTFSKNLDFVINQFKGKKDFKNLLPTIKENFDETTENVFKELFESMGELKRFSEEGLSSLRNNDDIFHKFLSDPRNHDDILTYLNKFHESFDKIQLQYVEIGAEASKLNSYMINAAKDAKPVIEQLVKIKKENAKAIEMLFDQASSEVSDGISIYDKVFASWWQVLRQQGAIDTVHGTIASPGLLSNLQSSGNIIKAKGIFADVKYSGDSFKSFEASIDFSGGKVDAVFDYLWAFKRYFNFSNQTIIGEIKKDITLAIDASKGLRSTWHTLKGMESLKKELPLGSVETHKIEQRED